jgi:uncharacterized protein (TIGR03067 family)
MRTPETLTRLTAAAALLALATVAGLCRGDEKGKDQEKGDPRAAARKDLARFQGTWTLVAMESEGHSVEPEDLAGRTSSYEGDLLTLRSGDQVRRRGIITLDPNRSPRAINTWDLNGPFQDRTIQGIYELSDDGDTLKLCFTGPDGDRPEKFTTKEGNGRLYVVYKRKKP